MEANVLFVKDPRVGEGEEDGEALVVENSPLDHYLRSITNLQGVVRPTCIHNVAASLATELAESVYTNTSKEKRTEQVLRHVQRFVCGGDAMHNEWAKLVTDTRSVLRRVGVLVDSQRSEDAIGSYPGRHWERLIAVGVFGIAIAWLWGWRAGILLCLLLGSLLLSIWYPRWSRTRGHRDFLCVLCATAECGASFDCVASRALRYVQEIELIVRGYKISSPLAPVSRLELTATTRRSMLLRRRLHSACVAVSKACSGGADQGTEDPDDKFSIARLRSTFSTCRRARHDLLLDLLVQLESGRCDAVQSSTPILQVLSTVLAQEESGLIAAIRVGDQLATESTVPRYPLLLREAREASGLLGSMHLQLESAAARLFLCRQLISSGSVLDALHHQSLAREEIDTVSERWSACDETLQKLLRVMEEERKEEPTLPICDDQRKESASKESPTRPLLHDAPAEDESVEIRATELYDPSIVQRGEEEIFFAEAWNTVDEDADPRELRRYTREERIRRAKERRAEEERQAAERVAFQSMLSELNHVIGARRKDHSTKEDSGHHRTEGRKEPAPTPCIARETFPCPLVELRGVLDTRRPCPHEVIGDDDEDEEAEEKQHTTTTI